MTLRYVFVVVGVAAVPKQYALKGPALPRVSHSSEIALVGSGRLRSTPAQRQSFLRTLLSQQPEILHLLPLRGQLVMSFSIKLRRDHAPAENVHVREGLVHALVTKQ